MQGLCRTRCRLWRENPSRPQEAPNRGQGEGELQLDQPGQTERFRRDLDALAAPEATLGIAVSGGPDSLALLILAAGVRPGRIEAATVDHGLREGSRDEAEMVADLCKQMVVPHQILTADWTERPASAIQEQARAMRYRLLGQWARHRHLDAICTAHHVDDQAETLLMRLARGAGVKGLAGMRPSGQLPGDTLPLLRPLLGWRHAELNEICEQAGVTPVDDPSNADEQYERVRVRSALATESWLDPKALGSSARHLAAADEALEWCLSNEWRRSATQEGGRIVYRPGDAPAEIRRRVVRRAILALAGEGNAAELRGRALDEVLAAMEAGRQSTLRGVLCSGGESWSFSRAPRRRHRSAQIGPV